MCGYENILEHWGGGKENLYNLSIFFLLLGYIKNSIFFFF